MAQITVEDLSKRYTIAQRDPGIAGAFNAPSYGGIEAAQYPLDIYTAWFRKFLIFIVPIGCVVYFPAGRT
jgi:hypothetical protein